MIYEFYYNCNESGITNENFKLEELKKELNEYPFIKDLREVKNGSFSGLNFYVVLDEQKHEEVSNLSWDFYDIVVMDYLFNLEKYRKNSK